MLHQRVPNPLGQGYPRARAPLSKFVVCPSWVAEFETTETQHAKLKTSRHMKISVLGAGAVGSMIGGLLKYYEPSMDVVLVARGEHGEALARRQAVSLIGSWGMHDVSLRTTMSPDEIAGSDVVIVTMKPQDTEQALAAAMPYLDDALVISVQNGINDHVLEQFVSRERLVIGTTGSQMALVQPGTVSLRHNGVTVVGPSRDGINHQASRQARNLLRMTGRKVVEHPNMLGVRYNKLVVNALGLSACLSASNFVDESVCHQLWRDYIASPLLEESLEILRRARIRLSPIPGGTDVFRIQRAFRILDKPLVGRAVQYFSQRIYGSRPIACSLAQDLRRGRKTEVDAINGELVRLAHSVGYHVPYNQLVQASLRQLESRADGSYPSEHEVLRRFQSIGHPPCLRIAG